MSLATARTCDGVRTVSDCATTAVRASRLSVESSRTSPSGSSTRTVATAVATSPKKPAQRLAAVKTAAVARKRVPNRHPPKVAANRDKTDAVVRALSASRAAPLLSRA